MRNEDEGFATGFLAGLGLGALQGLRSRFRGAFWRRRSRFSPVLAMFGALGLISACLTASLGVPLGLARAREVRHLPRLAADSLKALSPGAELLISGRLEAEGNGPSGLALYYVEARKVLGDGTPTPSSGDNPYAWATVSAPTGRLTLEMEDGNRVLAQLGANATFLNPQRYEQADHGVERRVVGYLPGQVLTAEGTWEGANLVTARALFGGGIDGYVAHVSRQPGRLLAFGGICGGISLALLALAAVLGLLGR